MDVFTREAAVEQERRDGGPGHQARCAGADGGRRELRGHDRPGQRVRHAGPGAARGSRAPDEAARGPQRHCRGGPGHPDAWPGPSSKEGEAAGHGVQGSPRQRTNRRIKAVEDAGAFRAPTNAARSFNP